MISVSIDLIEKAKDDENVRAFNACKVPKSYTFSELFIYALESLPQLDYPYAIGVTAGVAREADVRRLVAAADGGDDMLYNVAAKFTQVALNANATACMKELVEGPGGVPGDGPGPDSWGYQSCTENLHQFSSKGIRTYTFDLEEDAVKPCDALFNGTAVLNTSKLTDLYGGYALEDGRVTNIIFSNGALDPWHGGGLLLPKDKDAAKLHTYHGNGIHSIFMKLGAHHLDLRGPHPNDPAEITRARLLEAKIIKGFIDGAVSA